MFEHTLWDLKRDNAKVSQAIQRFEHTLWDLKLGFATSGGASRDLFEHTLWDLKPYHRHFNIDIVRLNIPYGI